MEVELVTMTAYRISPAPKFASMMTWDCARCGRDEVKPVFLSSPGLGTAAYGSGCAALLLGRTPAQVKKVAANVQAEADTAETVRQERRDRAARILAEAAATDTHPTEVAGRLEPMGLLRTYHLLGGAKVHGPFTTYLATVAETGEISA